MPALQPNPRAAHRRAPLRPSARAATARTIQALSLLPALALLAACAPRGAPSEPVPERGLPPVALVEGPLQPRVQYPAENQAIDARDSNFVHGSIGNGRATLTINGHPVQVAPNGAYIAFIPVPPADDPVYELVAAVGADTARLTRRVRVPAPRPPLDSARWLDSASVTPRAAGMLLRAGEPVRVAVRASGDAEVWVQWDTAAPRPASPPVAPAPRTTRRATTPPRDTTPPAPPPPARQALLRGTGDGWSGDVRAGILARGATLVAARGADTVRFPLSRVDVLDPSAPPRLAILGGDSALVASDTDRAIPARVFPAGGYNWALFPGTVVEVTGQQGAFTRFRLDETLDAWVDTELLAPRPAGGAVSRPTVNSFNFVPAAEWVDVRIPMPERMPYLVQEEGDALVLTLYGVRLGPSLVRFLENDSLVRYANWEQVTADRARLRLQLSSRPYGYLAFHERGQFTLRVRRAPRVNPRRPLEGITVAVDAGHPPAGATGPTGLYEGDAMLPVADRAAELLRAKGATVVRIRTTLEPYALGQRPIDARRANAHAFVSLHLNALGDGANPFTNNGHSVLYFHPQAEPLARALEVELVRQYGLRDLGVHFQNIAIGRTTWMPSVITEGLFIMMPEQEAAMRTPEGREKYARAVADGVERYFRWLAEQK